VVVHSQTNADSRTASLGTLVKGTRAEEQTVEVFERVAEADFVLEATAAGVVPATPPAPTTTTPAPPTAARAVAGLGAKTRAALLWPPRWPVGCAPHRPHAFARLTLTRFGPGWPWCWSAWCGLGGPRAGWPCARHRLGVGLGTGGVAVAGRGYRARVQARWRRTCVPPAYWPTGRADGVAMAVACCAWWWCTPRARLGGVGLGLPALVLGVVPANPPRVALCGAARLVQRHAVVGQPVTVAQPLLAHRACLWPFPTLR
jgi:hypothetical protein